MTGSNGQKCCSRIQEIPSMRTNWTCESVKIFFRSIELRNQLERIITKSKLICLNCDKYYTFD